MIEQAWCQFAMLVLMCVMIDEISGDDRMIAERQDYGQGCMLFKRII